MPANVVKFMTGTAAQFASAVKNENTLYFITDERRIYKGNVPYSGGMFASVQTLPASGTINTLYAAANGAVAYWDGTQYQYLVEPYVTQITDQNVDSDNLATVDAITDYVESVNSDLDSRLDVLEGDSTTAGSVAKALADAQAYTDTLANGQVATNTSAIAGLASSKADAATTLAGYGITDAYTKTETDSAIATAVGSAGHLKRQIVQTLPAVASADVDTIYMILADPSTGASNLYDEFMVINNAWEKIGDTRVDLTGYATETYADSVAAAAQSAAEATAASDATTKANAAKSYADGLITAEVTRADAAYATAAQGALADSAVQSVVEGDGNGQIKVDGTNVDVHGLGTAAYTASTAYDAAGSAATAESNANSYTDTQIAAAALVWETIS